VVEYLAECGAVINLRNKVKEHCHKDLALMTALLCHLKWRSTALHHAIMYDHIEVAERLIARGADITIKSAVIKHFVRLR